MLNLFLVVISTQFAETKRKEKRQMEMEKLCATPSSTSSSNESRSTYQALLRLFIILCLKIQERIMRCMSKIVVMERMRKQSTVSHRKSVSAILNSDLSIRSNSNCFRVKLQQFVQVSTLAKTYDFFASLP